MMYYPRHPPGIYSKERLLLTALCQFLMPERPHKKAKDAPAPTLIPSDYGLGNSQLNNGFVSGKLNNKPHVVISAPSCQIVLF